MTDPLTEAMLAKPVGPTVAARAVTPTDFTSKVEVKGDVAAVEVRSPQGEANHETAASAALIAQGENPADWLVTGFTSSEGSWGESKRFTFKRRGADLSEERPPLDELFATIKRHRPKAKRSEGSYGLIVALGDMQFGKIDGDGVEGTLARTIGCLDRAADLVEVYRKRFDIGHVHIAWLGDHIEGFVSQGGANVFRTPLTLNEQIRLTRRSMLHALDNFAPLAERVSMVAVPGNHGEPQRFAGKGITRYDDSHDTESLIAVADAAQLNTAAFGHVEFYVPKTDEMSVFVDVAGTGVMHAHGHAWTPGKHFAYWKGQAFHSPSWAAAQLLLAGHLHHEFIDTDGPKKFIQPPSMESESTWFRHRTGTTGDPGLVVAITKDGRTTPLEVVN